MYNYRPSTEIQTSWLLQKFLSGVFVKYIKLKVHTSANKAMRWVTTLFDVTGWHIESRVAVYKRSVFIDRFGNHPFSDVELYNYHDHGNGPNHRSFRLLVTRRRLTVGENIHGMEFCGHFTGHAFKGSLSLKKSPRRPRIERCRWSTIRLHSYFEKCPWMRVDLSILYCIHEIEEFATFDCWGKILTLI